MVALSERRRLTAIVAADHGVALRLKEGRQLADPLRRHLLQADDSLIIAVRLKELLNSLPACRGREVLGLAFEKVGRLAQVR